MPAMGTLPLSLLIASLTRPLSTYWTKDKTGSFKKVKGGWRAHMNEAPGATYVEPEPDATAANEVPLLVAFLCPTSLCLSCYLRADCLRATLS